MKVLYLFLIFLSISVCCISQSKKEKIAITVDFSESDKVISILQKLQKNQVISDSDWTELFNAIPYQLLQKREAAYNNTMSNNEFKRFVLSKDLLDHTSALMQTISAWRTIDMNEAGKQVFKYLPEEAIIKVKMFIVIKPFENSFVWSEGDNKYIFLYLNTSLSKAQLQNKVMHELHHIGMNSLDKKLYSIIAHLPVNQQNAISWLGGLSEGEAMLAAAGSPDVHPLQYDDTAKRNRWDRDMANFNNDLDSLQQFYLKILDGKLKNDDEFAEAASPFYGYQGPFYTVGYRMVSLIEKTFGRQILVNSYIDQRNLLILYNKAVYVKKNKKQNLKPWSSEIIKRLGTPEPPINSKSD